MMIVTTQQACGIEKYRKQNDNALDEVLSFIIQHITLLSK
jgi:hypothetical protein